MATVRIGKLHMSAAVEAIMKAVTVAAVPGVVFVRTKDAAQTVCDAMTAAGHNTALVTGDLALDSRRDAKQALMDGSLDWVVATSAWATGVDIPNLASIVNAAGGKAPIGLKQMAGRGIRLSEGKTAFTLYDLSLGDRRAQRARQKHYANGGLTDDIDTQDCFDPLLARLLGEA